MSSTSVFVALAVLFIVAVTGQQSLNVCPNVTPMRDYDSARIAGEWIGTYRFNSDVTEPEIRCVKASMEVDNAGVVTCRNRLIQGNENIDKIFIGTPVDNNRAKINFVYTSDPNLSIVYTILASDYDHWMIWVSCNSQNGYKATVMSRQNSLTAAQLQDVKQALCAANLSDQLIEINNNNCNY